MTLVVTERVIDLRSWFALALLVLVAAPPQAWSGPLLEGLNWKERSALYQIAKGNRRSLIPGATFGFETEFRGSNKASVLPWVEEDTHRVRTERFPFLLKDYIREDTGNWEVRSKPTGELEDALEQMERMFSVLGDDLRSFHLHIRFPKKALAGLSDANFKGWLSRLGDSVFTWRLEERDPYYAMVPYSQGRNNPELLREKRVLRLQKLGVGKLDVEIRGYMESIPEIRSLARTLLLGLHFPELVQGYSAAQKRLYSTGGPTLKDKVAAYVLAERERKLTAAEGKYLAKLQATGAESWNRHLPTLPLAQMPYFTEDDREGIESAAENFWPRVLRLAQEQLENGHTVPSAGGLESYHYVMKRFSREAGLNDALDEHLLQVPEKPSRACAAALKKLR